jgi:hypothetical protein
LVIVLGVVLWARAMESSGATHAGETFVDDIELEPHDFGKLVGHVDTIATLTVRNDTDSIWTLRRTWSACGCVKVGSASERVEPGEDAIFELRIDTRGQPEGPLTRQSFALYDPGPRRITFTATALIAPRPHFVPHVLDVELGDGVSAWREEAWIVSPFASATVEVVSSAGDVEVVFATPESTEIGTRLPFVCAGTLPGGAMRRDVSLTFAVFGDPELPEGEELVLRGTIRRVPPLSVSPSVLVLEGDSDVLRGRVWLRRADGTWPTEVELRVPEGDACDVAYDPDDGSSAVEARVTDAGSSSIRLGAVAPSSDAVEFPVRVVRRSRAR